MDWKSILKPRPQPPVTSIVLLLLRVVAGAAFAIHGWGKIQHPFDWMGPSASTSGFLQFLAAISEFGGGLCWILGLVTPIASLGILCTMAYAVHFHWIVNGHPFVDPTGGPAFELAAVYLTLAVSFILLGPGRLSLDSKIFGQRP